MTVVVAGTYVVSLSFKGHSLSDKYLDAVDGRNLALSSVQTRERRSKTLIE
jgi:hypothetical protein